MSVPEKYGGAGNCYVSEQIYPEKLPKKKPAEAGVT
jgi:hypothetical protein